MGTFKDREAKFYIAVGARSIGKTYISIKLMKQILGGNTQTGAKPRKGLIFDFNDEFKEFKAIECTIENICLFVKQPTVEIRRITPKKAGRIKTTEDFSEDLKIILQYYMNGVLVLEDLNLIVGDTIPKNIIGALSTIRHRDVDVITHFQSIAKFSNPKFKALKNILRLHKASDSSNRNTVMKNLGEDYPKVRIAEIILNNRYMFGIRKMQELEAKGLEEGCEEWEKADKKFRRFYLYVDFDKQKIYGNFSRQEFENALAMYFQEEKRNEIDPLLKLLDLKTGKPLFNFQTAIKEKMVEYSMIYGNPK